jgi:Flp pilus assembly protein TadG
MRARRPDNCGAVAIEYAFVLPILLLLLLGSLECSRLFWTYMTLYWAAEAAARCGAVNATICPTAALIQAYAVTQAYGLTISASAFTAASATCGMQATASFPFTLVIPWIAAGTASGSFNIITLNPTACYPQ